MKPYKAANLEQLAANLLQAMPGTSSSRKAGEGPRNRWRLGGKFRDEAFGNWGWVSGLESGSSKPY